MLNTCHSIIASLQGAQFFSIVKTLILLIAGFVLARLASQAAPKLVSRYATSQQSMILKKSIYFIILGLFIIAALQQLGFKISVLLGSAGVLTVAAAIASQTSISNMVSGIFLIMEKSFQIGDKIKVGNTTGVVSSIDLLSVKILTAQNTLIRVPNETLIKSEITNITRFESRRLDLNFKVSSEENITNIKKLLLDIVTQHSLVEKTPLPTVSITEIDSTGVYLQLSMYVNQKSYDQVADDLYEEILIALQQNNISL